MLPKVQRLRDRFIASCKLIGINLRVTSEFRSFDEQNKLYAQGRTTVGPIVTNAKGGESFHNYGVAFDVAIVRNGVLDYNITPLVAWIGKFLGLTWGGNWDGFVDKPHFQYDCGYTLKDFQDGKIDKSKYE